MRNLMILSMLVQVVFILSFSVSGLAEWHAPGPSDGEAFISERSEKLEASSGSRAVAGEQARPCSDQAEPCSKRADSCTDLSLAKNVTKTVVDMRGTSVRIPADPRRVATISDGFVEGVMTHLGVIDRVVAIGSWSMKLEYMYSLAGGKEGEGGRKRVNTMKLLHPWIDSLPCVTSPQGDMLNFETLARAEPELVIIRVGDCTMGSGDAVKTAQTIKTMESMGMAVVVLYAPGHYRKAELASMQDELAILGEIFGQKEKAVALGRYLEETEELITKRTKEIAEEDRTRVLYLGLRPSLRKKGAAGSVFGTNTPESYIIETVAHAENAFRGQGYGVPISIEQVYALDPDVIVLPTQSGYHPPSELYDDPYFAGFSELRAVQERRVYAMPWTPKNCSRRLEYPLDMLVIAKAAYPGRFRDVSVYDFALKLYQDLYGVDSGMAAKLRDTQILDWMPAYDF